MRPLTLKLFRDLLRLRGQALTIALVVMAGVASWVGLRSTFESLSEARDAYYERQSFGDMFADCVRAPVSLVPRIEEIEGVSRVSATVVAPIRFRPKERATPGGAESPAIGALIGLPPGGPSVDIPRLMRGRAPDPTSEDEALLLDAFAEAHSISVGDSVTVVVSGSERTLRVVGTAAAPEYLFAIAPGDMTGDAKRFGVAWINLDAARKLTDLPGAFNHVSLALAPNSAQDDATTEVREKLDALLLPYGGAGSYPRAEQPSNRGLEQELVQLRSMAMVMPIIFLGVAAFLLNAVLARLVALERPEIAALRALGYTGVEVAVHYLQLVLTISIVGAFAGTALGAWLGRAMINLYAQYFHFPDPPFRLEVGVVATGVLTSVGAATVGGLFSAYRIVRLPPAEAMRPPAPEVFRMGLLDRMGLSRLLSPANKMVLRQVTRAKARVALSVTGLGFAIAINVMARFNGDILDAFMTLMFSESMREDVAVSFRAPVDPSAVHSIASLPGVLRAEPLRTTPVEVVYGQVKKRRALVCHAPDDTLRRFVDRYGHEVPVPRFGIALDDLTASQLGVQIGDHVSVHALEGRRRTSEVPVEVIYDGMTSLEAHTSFVVAEAITGEVGLSGVAVTTDQAREAALVARLDDAPNVFSVTRRSELLARFEALTGETMTTMTLLLTFFASVIAIGVVYNDARILLSSQSRELASLRVLGLTRAEVSHVLLGQVAVEVALAIVPGVLLGDAGARAIASTADPELYRFPVVISPGTYVASVLVVIGAAIVSALLVRRRIDHLDLVSVLKTRD